MEEFNVAALVISGISLFMTLAMAWWARDSDNIVQRVIGFFLWLLIGLFSLPFLIIGGQSIRTAMGLIVFVSTVGFFMPELKKMVFRMAFKAPVK